MGTIWRLLYLAALAAAVAAFMAGHATSQPAPQPAQHWRILGTEAMVALESYVDAAGLRNVLWALAHIAGAKSEHVATVWQDTRMAKQWDKAARHLERLAGAIPATPLD
jgi:hypothetical protein